MTQTHDAAPPLALSESAVSLKGGGQLDVADLVLLGLHRRIWQEFETSVRIGISLDSRHPDAVGEEEVRAAATSFRYRHGLISAADFRSWLDARSLTVSDVRGVLRRGLLRERFGDGQPTEASDSAIAVALRAEVLCNGVLRALAEVGIQCLIAAHPAEGGLGPGSASTPDEVGADEPEEDRAEEADEVVAEVLSRDPMGLRALGEPELRTRLRRLCRMEAALWQLRSSVADGETISRTLADHRLDWLGLSGQEMTFASEGAAREARLLIDEDGVGIAEVAKRAGTEVRERVIYLEGAQESARGQLAAAVVGEVVGPWLEGDAWRLFVVTAKHVPSLSDPVLRDRATQEVLDDVIRRRGAGRVSRHLAL